MSAFRTLPLDRGAERSVAALRLVAAVVVAACAIWLVLVERSRAAGACAALSLLASIAWIGMGLAARRRLRDASRWRLVLGPEGLSLIEGARERRVAWEDVAAIETDDDRLVVEIRLRNEAEPLVVEPRYGGLGVVDLEAAIRAAREQAAASAHRGAPAAAGAEYSGSRDEARLE